MPAHAKRVKFHGTMEELATLMFKAGPMPNKRKPMPPGIKSHAVTPSDPAPGTVTDVHIRDINQLSVDDIEQELARRKKRGGWLLSKLAALDAQRAELVAQIRLCGVKPETAAASLNGTSEPGTFMGLTLTAGVRASKSGIPAAWQVVYRALEPGRTYSPIQAWEAVKATGTNVSRSGVNVALATRKDVFDNPGPAQYSKKMPAQAAAASPPLASGDLKARVEALGKLPEGVKPFHWYTADRPNLVEMVLRLGGADAPFSGPDMMAKINATGLVKIEKVDVLTKTIRTKPGLFKWKVVGHGQTAVTTFTFKRPKR